MCCANRRRSPIGWMLLMAGPICLVSLALLLGNTTASAQDETDLAITALALTDLAIEVRVFEDDRTGSLDPTGLAFAPSANESPVLKDAAITFQVDLIRTLDMSALTPPSSDSSGLAYISSRNTLLMSDGEIEETVDGITHFQGANVWELTLDGSVVITANISTVTPTVVPMSNEPTGVAWDPFTGDFFMTDDSERQVYLLKPGADGRIGTADDTWSGFSTRPAGNLDPEGIAYDPEGKRLYVVDGANREVYVYTVAGELVGQFDVDRYGVEDPESVEFNPYDGTLFIMSSRRREAVIIETTTGGDLLQTFDISVAQAHKPAGLAYAPASDGSGAMRFYVLDRGVDNNTNPELIDGKLYELTAPGVYIPPPDPPAPPDPPDPPEPPEPPVVDPEETLPYWLYLPLLIQ